MYDPAHVAGWEPYTLLDLLYSSTLFEKLDPKHTDLHSKVTAG